jgi:flagellar assembly protein FliH
MAQVIRSVQVHKDPVVLTYRDAGRRVPEAAPVHPEVRPQPMPAPLPPAQPVPDFGELRKQAFEDGYRDGYEAGAAQAKAELAKEAEKLARLLGSAEAALARQIEGLEDVTVEIAFAAVCKLLGEAARTEDGVRSLVREAMRGIQAKEGVVVRVAPADRDLLAASNGEGKVEVAADERVALGGCIIETSGGTLDARLEVQLQQLVDTLRRARSAPQAE